MSDLRAVIFDYGGVLTSPLVNSMDSFVESDGIDPKSFRTAMREWLGLSYSTDAEVSPVHALERGELEVPAFERELAARLRTMDGGPVEAEGLLTRMFAGFGFEPVMAQALRHAKAAGFATALLSNSWGLDYPRDSWEEMFDVVVISGEVGMRKPEQRIYRLVADQLALAPQQCVFVDDLEQNVQGAADVGMIGVHHVTPQETLEKLESLLGVPLRG